MSWIRLGVSASSDESLPPRRRRPAGTSVLASFAGWLLCLALLPLRIATVYGGLPAHPLFLHVPVVLIPIVALAFLVPDRWVHLGTRLALAAVLTLAATVLTVDAGFALRGRLEQQSQGLPPPASSAPGGLIARPPAVSSYRTR